MARNASQSPIVRTRYQGPSSPSSRRREATSNRQNTVAPAVSPARTSVGFSGLRPPSEAAEAGAASAPAADVDEAGTAGAADVDAVTAAEDAEGGMDMEDADDGAPCCEDTALGGTAERGAGTTAECVGAGGAAVDGFAAGPDVEGAAGAGFTTTWARMSGCTAQ